MIRINLIKQVDLPSLLSPGMFLPHICLVYFVIHFYMKVWQELTAFLIAGILVYMNALLHCLVGIPISKRPLPLMRWIMSAWFYGKYAHMIIMTQRKICYGCQANIFSKVSLSIDQRSNYMALVKKKEDTLVFQLKNTSCFVNYRLGCLKDTMAYAAHKCLSYLLLLN